VFRRTLAIVASAAVLGALTAAPAVASRRDSAFPTTIALPAGFQPEGIATGLRAWAWLGSRANGDIYRVDLRTGRGAVLSKGPGTPSLGMKVDRRGRLWVAGGTGGDGRLIDARTGELLDSWRFTTGTTFVNDVALARGAAWFTDSLKPQLYRVARGRVSTVALTGDLTYVDGFNANGISPTPDGRALLVVQSNTGKLFRVTVRGVSTTVDLGGESVANGDGLWLHGRTLYVVQNVLNRVAVFRLNRKGTRGHLVQRVTDPRFDVPTTIAEFHGRLYLPNARFTTPPTPQTDYAVVAITRP
jgi:sugar lactone lactonase YvrE